MREKINCFKHCSVSTVTVNRKIESPEDNPKYLICLLCCCSEGIPSRHLRAGAKRVETRQPRRMVEVIRPLPSVLPLTSRHQMCLPDMQAMFHIYNIYHIYNGTR